MPTFLLFFLVEFGARRIDPIAIHGGTWRHQKHRVVGTVEYHLGGEVGNNSRETVPGALLTSSDSMAAQARDKNGFSCEGLDGGSSR